MKLMDAQCHHCNGKITRGQTLSFPHILVDMSLYDVVEKEKRT